MYRPSYEHVEGIGELLLGKTKHRPTIGIICGSGFGVLADLVKDADIVPYDEIPSFSTSTVPGHMGTLVFGILGGKQVVLMRGRLHNYEGYPMWKTTIPVRVFKACGISTLILTNAAGGVNIGFNVGDIMIIRDHVDLLGLTGKSALRGTNDERFGPQFLATVNTYDQEMKKLTKLVANELGLGEILKEGTYMMTGGPCYATVAEMRLFRMFGVDAVGMSTVPEAVVARHMGMKVFGLSLITDTCPLDFDSCSATTHEQVLAAGQKRAKDLQQLVSNIIQRM